MMHLVGLMKLDMKKLNLLLFIIFSSSLSLLLAEFATPQNNSPNTTTWYHVGVILDMSSWVGKEANSCISMAISDFYAKHSHYKTRLVLHTKDSKGEPLRALSAAVELIESQEVQAIIGPQTSDEAAILVDLADKAEVPIISFSATSPFISSVKNPYFLRTTPDDTSQVRAIAAIVQAFRWREVVLIYEDSFYGNGIIPSLFSAFEEINARVPYRSVIPTSASDDQIIEELYKLIKMETRVFVVHASSSLASHLFLKVNEMGMMSEGYAWIITDGLTNLMHFMDSSVIDSMQGILGIRPYVPPSKALSNFTSSWRLEFHRDNPNIETLQLSVFGIWAYDTVSALARAAERVGILVSQSRELDIRNNLTDLAAIAISQTGSKLLETFSHIIFKGLGGNFQYIPGKIPSFAFQIVNVIGRGERGIGYWTSEDGLLQKINASNNRMYSASMTALENIIWPGISMAVPKSWVMPLSGKKLKIGVPIKVGFRELVKVEYDRQTNATIVTGFCIDVFNAAINALPYPVPYEFIPFPNGSYNDLIYQVYLQEFDAAVGDITIRANRSLYVDFTLPFTDGGVGTIMLKGKRKNMWIFLKPLDVNLWITSGAFFIWTGFVIWVLEHHTNNDFQGPPAQQLGTVLWFSFSTLVFVHREKLVSNLSRFVLIVWLFVVLVLNSSYTASLTSMLTVQKLQLDPKKDYIGYHSGSTVEGLVSNLNFEHRKPYNSIEEYADALTKGSVSAIMDEIPYLKLFPAKYHTSYTMLETIQSTPGFAFAFQRGSPLVSDISRAIESLREEGKLDKIEQAWFSDDQSTSTYLESPSNANVLNLHSFGGLFLTTAISSISALIIFLVFFLYEHWQALKSFNLENSTWGRLVSVLKTPRVRLSTIHEAPNEGQLELDTRVPGASPNANFGLPAREEGILSSEVMEDTHCP